jgi:hypothetical protein
VRHHSFVYKSQETKLKHPLIVHSLTEATYDKYVKVPTAKGNYPHALAGFLATHPGATHGVFDAQGRLVYIGKEADLRAAHMQIRFRTF